MDIKKGIVYLQDHPMMLAIVIAAGFFVYFQMIKKNTVTAPVASTPPAPTSSEQFIQQYNSYPTGGQVIQQSGMPYQQRIITSGGPRQYPITQPLPVPPVQTPPQPKPPQPKPQTAHYVTVKPWPDQLSTLSGIAGYAGISLARVESLNPQYKNNWNLIYAGQQVRVA